MKWIGWFCLLLLLSGCQQPLTRSGESPGVRSAAVVETPGEALRNLIDFSTRFEAHTRQDQLALCAELRQSLDQDRDRWTGWYLATAISQVEGCGEPEEAVALINRLLDQRFVSREAGWLAYYQIRLLQRQQRQRQQLNKAVAEQQKLEQRLTRVVEARRLLENQLRDLKRIETSINQRLDEKEQGTNPTVTEPAGATGR